MKCGAIHFDGLPISANSESLCICCQVITTLWFIVFEQMPIFYCWKQVIRSILLHYAETVNILSISELSNLTSDKTRISKQDLKYFAPENDANPFFHTWSEKYPTNVNNWWRFWFLLETVLTRV